MRRVQLALVVLAWVGCASTWRELKTDHFILHTDLSADEARDVARKLEFTLAALERATKLTAKGAIHAIAFGSEAEYQRLSPSHTGGYFAENGSSFAQRPTLAFPATVFWRDRTVAHELTHALIARFAPHLPLWLNEGLAAYFETIAYDSTDERLVVGRIDPARLERVARAPRTRLAEMWAWRSYDFGASRERGVAYSMAGMWIHFLRERHEHEFELFMRGLGRGEDVEGAFSAAFGADSAPALDVEMSEYVKRDAFTTRRFQMGSPKHNVVERMMSEGEWRVLLASVAVNSEIANEVLQEARQEAQQEPVFHFIVHRFSSQHRDSDGFRLLDEASQMEAAFSLADLASANVPALRQVMAAAPDAWSPRIALARVLMALDRVPEATTLLEEAVDLAPWTDTAWAALAEARALQGRWQDAVGLQRRALRIAQTRLPPDRVPKVLTDALVVYEAGRLLKADADVEAGWRELSFARVRMVTNAPEPEARSWGRRLEAVAAAVEMEAGESLLGREPLAVLACRQPRECEALGARPGDTFGGYVIAPLAEGLIGIVATNVASRLQAETTSQALRWAWVQHHLNARFDGDHRVTFGLEPAEAKQALSERPSKFSPEGRACKLRPGRWTSAVWQTHVPAVEGAVASVLRAATPPGPEAEPRKPIWFSVADAVPPGVRELSLRHMRLLLAGVARGNDRLVQANELISRQLADSPNDEAAAYFLRSYQLTPSAHRASVAALSTAGDEWVARLHVWAVPPGTRWEEFSDEQLRQLAATVWNDSGALNEIAWDIAAGEQSRRAGFLADRLVEVAPTTPGKLDTAAAVFAELGRCDEAISLLRRALSLEGCRVEAYQSFLEAIRQKCASRRR